MAPEPNELHSWGKVISFHDDGNDRSILDSFDTESNNDAKVSSRLESKLICIIATSENHSVCNTLHTRYCSECRGDDLTGGCMSFVNAVVLRLLSSQMQGVQQRSKTRIF